MDGGKKGECCLLVLDSVTSTPQWIRRTKPRARERERERERETLNAQTNTHTHTHIKCRAKESEAQMLEHQLMTLGTLHVKVSPVAY